MAVSRRKLSKGLFTGATLLLAALAFVSYWRYLDGVSTWRERSRLGSGVDGTSHVSGKPDGAVGRGRISDEDVEQDRRGLRTLLFPDQHIYRSAQTIRLQWNVTTAPSAPDGVKRTIFFINGQFPGPTIEARSGDELEIEVTNLAHNGEEISIHWHGLTMRDANEMDSVVGLTQCAISRGQTFTYRFRVNETQHGTFWYHAHSGVQLADGLYGGLVVHQPAAARNALQVAEACDAEQLLLIGDWYHKSAQGVLDWFLDFSHFGNDPAPDSLLVNGRGHFDCSMAVPANPVDCNPIEAPEVTLYGQRTRLRVVNTGALTGFTLAMPGSRMRVIELDGGCSVADAPAAESVGVLHPGERMDVVVEQQTSGGGTSLIVALDRETLKFKNFALTPTQSFRLLWSGNSQTQASQPDASNTAVVQKHFDLASAVGVVADLDVPVPAAVSETAVVYTRLEILASYGNVPLGVVNHTSWLVTEPKTRPLLALDRSQWPSMRDGPDGPPPPGQIVRDVPRYNRNADEHVWMDLVVNNLDEKGHPFHLHGYSFYVVAQYRSPTGAYAAYNPFDPASSPAGGHPVINTATPLRKDTVYVPRMGYAVLRLRLDNMGLWLLHCHALWHHAAGMGMVLQVGGPAPVAVQTKAGALCSA